MFPHQLDVLPVVFFDAAAALPERECCAGPADQVLLVIRVPGRPTDGVDQLQISRTLVIRSRK